MQHVYTARDSMEAHFLKGLLEQEGIDAIVQGEALSAALGALPLTAESLPSVWVEDADVERAAVVIDDYKKRDEEDAGEGPPRATWKCPSCGEAIEEQFTQCWNCGKPRPMGDPAATA